MQKIYIMKQVTVALDVFLGYTHHGYVSKTHNLVIEISDEVAVILQDLQTHLECPLTDEDITGAIKKKKQLQPLKELHEILMTRCYDLETLHWSEDYCYQVSDSQIKKSFKQDIEDGLYTPQPDDEDYKGRLYFSKCQDHYYSFAISSLAFCPLEVYPCNASFPHLYTVKITPQGDFSCICQKKVVPLQGEKIYEYHENSCCIFRCVLRL